MFNGKMRNLKVAYMAIFFMLMLGPVLLVGQAGSDGVISKTIALKYIFPDDLTEELYSQKYLDDKNNIIINNGETKLTINNATNQILLTGNALAITNAMQLIEFLDVSPRQIIIEAKIVELDNNKMSNLGMDWQYILDRAYTNPGFMVNKTFHNTNTDGISHESEESNASLLGNVGGTHIVGDFLKIIQENGAGKIISVPKIVTTNNKKGMILDGYRITYVSKAAGYANIFETQEMTAGLSLAVTPSLGGSGYLKMIISAKLTTLAEIIGGSPSELGQIIENTVIVKDGEEFLLGGFKKTESSKLRRRVPILGSILPFLFSRTTTIETTKDFLIVLKPIVIDLNPPEIPEIK